MIGFPVSFDTEHHVYPPRVILQASREELLEKDYENGITNSNQLIVVL